MINKSNIDRLMLNTRAHIETEYLIDLATLCDKAIGLDGKVLEVGVGWGGSGLVLAESFKDRSVYLCDTFTGIPYHDVTKDNFHVTGDMNDEGKIDVIKKLFEPYKNVSILKGIFPDDTFKYIENEKLCFVNLDVDMYKSYKDSLSVIYNNVVRGGIICLHDYNLETCQGATIACDEFANRSGEKIRKLNSYYYIEKGNKDDI